MKVLRLNAKDVNGILNFNFSLHDHLNFLIGINGSGKTTALKLLLGLITPSQKFLNKIDFKKALLECQTDNGDKILIEAAKKETDLLSLSLKINGILKAKNEFPLYENRLKYDDDGELVVARKFEHLKVVQAIRELKTPVFLGLDRRIFLRKAFEETNRDYERRKIISPEFRRKKRDAGIGDAMDISILEIQELVKDYIREIAEEQPKITEKFKSEILNDSINYYSDRNVLKVEGIDEQTLKDKRESLEKAVKDLAIGDFKQRIDSFFVKFEKLNKSLNKLSKKAKSKSDIDKSSLDLFAQMMMNRMQLKRIDDIIELSQEYQNKITQLREPINRLNGILFKFFEESKKKIEVLPNGKFEITLSNGEIATPFELSSGEKQILIMITHLIFYEDRTSPGIFIIDEPELSLHLGWQEIFVSSILAASPSTQFILATHSPSIIGGIENEKYCVDVN